MWAASTQFMPKRESKDSSRTRWQKPKTLTCWRQYQDTWLDGHGSEWTPGVGDGQGGLACCDSWDHKESDTTEQLNWTELRVLCPWGFSRQEYWSGLLCPPPRDPSDPEIEPTSPISPALASGFFTTCTNLETLYRFIDCLYEILINHYL